MLIATLASVEFHDDCKIPPQLSYPHKIIKTAPTGLCMWSCLWLATQADLGQMISWSKRTRSVQGYAGGDDQKWEQKVVQEWALGLKGMPEKCRERVEKSHSAEDEDIVL